MRRDQVPFPELRGIPLSDCRACTMPIRFVQLDTGKALPVDPQPNPKGNVCARKIGGRLHGYVISRDHTADPMFLRMMPHHPSCEAEQKKQPRQDDPVLFDVEGDPA